MDTWTSDFIISISVIFGALVAKMLPKKVKLVWRIIIALIVAICLSMLGHIIVNVACSSNNDKHLVGRWKVESYANPFTATLGHTHVSSDENYILQIQNTGAFWFSTDCNTISGEYIVTEQDIKFENLSATELACDNDIVERSIKRELPMVVSYDLPNDSTLCLLSEQGNALITLIKVNIQE